MNINLTGLQTFNNEKNINSHRTIYSQEVQVILFIKLVATCLMCKNAPTHRDLFHKMVLNTCALLVCPCQKTSSRNIGMGRVLCVVSHGGCSHSWTGTVGHTLCKDASITYSPENFGLIFENTFCSLFLYAFTS